jgi:phytoene synthase
MAIPPGLTPHPVSAPDPAPDPAPAAPGSDPLAGPPLGTDLYYSLLYLPAPTRRYLGLVHAFQGELQALPRRIQDPGILAHRLDWWRAELVRLANRRAEHPLCRALAAAATEAGTHPPVAAMAGLVEALAAEIETPGFRALPHLLAFCEALALPATEAALEALGHRAAATPPAARRLAGAMEAWYQHVELRAGLAVGLARLPIDLFAAPEAAASTARGIAAAASAARGIAAAASAARGTDTDRAAAAATAARGKDMAAAARGIAAAASAARGTDTDRAAAAASAARGTDAALWLALGLHPGAAQPQQIAAVLRAHGARLRAGLREARAAFPAADAGRHRHLLIQAALVATEAALVGEEGDPVLRQRSRLPPLRKLWIAWRTRLAPARAHRRP